MEENKLNLNNNDNRFKNIKDDVDLLQKSQVDASSFGSKSGSSMTSIDTSNFNRVKNGILENQEISSIKYMKFLTFFFCVGTVILIIIDSIQSKSKFFNLNSYILQNLFFNHSKISVSCVYFSTLNLKYIKNRIYNNINCNNLPCDIFYSDLLEFCVGDIKTQKQTSNNFVDDFKNILFEKKDINLNIYNMTKKKYNYHKCRK